MMPRVFLILVYKTLNVSRVGLASENGISTLIVFVSYPDVVRNISLVVCMNLSTGQNISIDSPKTKLMVQNGPWVENRPIER